MACNLADLVRVLYREAPHLGLREAAARIAADITEDDRLECLEIALISYVRDVHSKMRQGNPIINGQLFSRTDVPEMAPLPPAVRSRKIELAREWWASRINDPIGTPDGVKPLGDCTVKDLEYAAEVRLRIAHSNAVSATNFRKLATHMRDQGVDTVRGLRPQ